ncbi:hypothetical protein [Nostoc sphaeroides]|uniref:Uncharacterized protein n=1 Tax=Nostoc sphaeroides CCNUC1 TaxID=2653204 RepID=A0A5P8W4D9_9NOSO|nr:hypothetical protein [Nostoc sphaeroides]MCC5631362.1 hypothetical protein [Nostoc sphaeroides CHAB 2801]QFS47603.1 hypothetical protein GXM_05095 [Nostoc sphaeroides CCNUC1]
MLKIEVGLTVAETVSVQRVTAYLANKTRSPRVAPDVKMSVNLSNFTRLRWIAESL